MTGSGTQADPYKIYNVTDLQNIENDLTAYYELANDIDASATSGWNGGDGFDPIGGFVTPFTGFFNGKGYTISDLTVNRGAEDYNGLFGYVGEGATFSNVNMEDTSITGDSSAGALVGRAEGCTITNVGVIGGSISADRYIGGLVGYIRRGLVASTPFTIENCYATCSVTGGRDTGGLIGYASPSDDESSVSDCYATGNITADASGIGGLIGTIVAIGALQVTRCYATGEVITTGDDNGGGLIGASGVSAILKCYATGDVSIGRNHCGGLIGSVGRGSVTDCYARGNATAGGHSAGGLIGSNVGAVDRCYSTGIPSVATLYEGGLVGGNAGTVTNSFWDTETSDTGTSDGGTGKTTAEMKSKGTFAGWNFKTIWNMLATVNDGYACLCNVTGSCPLTEYKGNTNIDQLLYQHVERIDR